VVGCRGGTAWSTDIPPFTTGLVINTLAGLNSIGMRRKGLSAEARRDIKRAFHLTYRSGQNISQAVTASESMDWTPEGAEFMDFIRNRGKRGLCHVRALSGSADPAGSESSDATG